MNNEFDNEYEKYIEAKYAEIEAAGVFEDWLGW